MTGAQPTAAETGRPGGPTPLHLSTPTRNTHSTTHPHWEGPLS